MTRRWRIALLLAAIAAVWAANHWRYWWAPAYQKQMVDQPCPDDPAADPLAVPGDVFGICVHRADNRRLAAAGLRPELVFYGDSIVGDWDELQPGLFGRDWVNRGIGGHSSAALLPRFRQDVIALRPRAVLIEAGINDVIGRGGLIGPAEYLANIESLIDLAQANGIAVIVATMPPVERFPTRPRLAPYPRIEQLNTALREMAARRGAVLADFHAALVGPDGKTPRPGLSLDGVHPSAQAYALLEPVVRRAQAALPARPAEQS
ncbi:GDSL-type esterase/lipase family protein [Novosphingobium sp. B 225]|uniref:GDSL-type esterase/lipase family protein n=1 Tax=Novosphingobium sp. B 225 TaxID=1961849 RepID=UPI000B4B24A8|nr:GDSL-type esterase/lipase family protein [Novosphingobium sp. B 225]